MRSSNIDNAVGVYRRHSRDMKLPAAHTALARLQDAERVNP